MNFGYSINQPRSINLDKNDLSYSRQLLREHPELETCIAGNLTSFNLRKVQTLVRRGEYAGAYEELSKCMLCGKCRLVCPRGINTREIVLTIKKHLAGK